jgi:hypothetical protein
MEPIANGFLVLIGASATLGAFVGAIGGAAVWRLRMNLVLGGLLTACALTLVFVAEHPEDQTWLRAKLIWGVPPMTVTFLAGTVAARWLEIRMAVRSIWTALAAFGVALCLGFLHLLLFRYGPKAPLLAAPGFVLGLILLLFLIRRRGLAQPQQP